MRFNKSILFSLSIAIFSSINYGFTENKDETPVLEPITLVAEKSPASEDLQRDVFPYHVSVIELKPEDIQNISLQNLLEQQVSLQVSSFGGRANYSTVSIRGSTASQVTVFIDGIEVNRGDRQTVDLSTLPIEQFERVEIYRSHAPARFGTGTIGGVINLISRKAHDHKSGSLKLGIGSFGFYESAIQSSVQHQNTQHRFSLSHEQAEGDFDYVDDNLTTHNPNDDVNRTRINNDYKAYRLGWFGQKNLNSEQELTWSLTYFDRNKGLAGQARFQSPDTRYLEKHFGGKFGYHTRGLISEDSHTHINIGLQYNKDQYIDRNSNIGLGSQDNKYPVQSQSIGLVHQLNTYPLNHTFNLTFKNDRQQTQDILNNSYTPANKRNKWDFGYESGLFLFKDLLEITASLKSIILNDQLKSAITPTNRSERHWAWSFAARYELHSTLHIKSSISKGFRIPSFSELFGDRGSLDGNDQLVSEKSTNVDLGFHFKKDELGFLKNFESEVSIFQSKRDDLIAMFFDSRGVARPFNLGDGIIKGLEWDTKTDLPFYFSLGQSFTWLDTELARSNLAGGKGKQVPGIFEQTWSPYIKWHKYNTTITYRVSVEKDKFYDVPNLVKAPDKEIHHLSLQYKLNKANLALDIHNLTNEQFEDFNKWPNSGRLIIFSTLVHF